MCITEDSFFELWKNSCKDKDKLLINSWNRSLKYYTERILTDSDCIMNTIKDYIKNQIDPEIELFLEYNKCDAIFYKKNNSIIEDPIKKAFNMKNPNLNGIYVNKIEILFEHENDILTSWQELLKFCLYSAELNVLVTYPDCTNEENQRKTKKVYEDILKKANCDKKILLIFGIFDNRKPNELIKWQGFKWQNNSFVEL